ncbi:MAG: hypothetical protein ABWX60_07740 [Aeromicrobium sp.]
MTAVKRSTPHEQVVVLRLWTEAHDPRPRGRLIVAADEPGEPLIGTPAILAALETVLRSFEAAGPAQDAANDG